MTEKCPQCGGHVTTSQGHTNSFDFCVDCDWVQGNRGKLSEHDFAIVVDMSRRYMRERRQKAVAKHEQRD